MLLLTVEDKVVAGLVQGTAVHKLQVVPGQVDDEVVVYGKGGQERWVEVEGLSVTVAGPQHKLMEVKVRRTSMMCSRATSGSGISYLSVHPWWSTNTVYETVRGLGA